MKAYIDILISELLYFIAKATSQKYSEKKITIISLAGIGDHVLAMPAIMRKVKNGVRITLITSKNIANLFNGTNFFEKILIESDVNFEDFKKIARYSDRIYSIRTNSRFLNYAINSSAVRKWYPHPQYERLRMLQRLFSIVSRRYKRNLYGNQHMKEVLEGLLEEKTESTYNWIDYIDDVELPPKVSAFIDRNPTFRILNVGGSSEIRKIKYETLQTLISSGTWVLVGDKDDAIRCNSLVSNDNILNTIGELSIRQLISLIRKSTLVVCPDSLIMHLANDVKIPLVALMGNALESTFGPYNKKAKTQIINRNPPCSPCSVNICKKFNGFSCVQDIEASEIIESIEKISTQ